MTELEASESRNSSVGLFSLQCIKSILKPPKKTLFLFLITFFQKIDFFGEKEKETFLY